MKKIIQSIRIRSWIIFAIGMIALIVLVFLNIYVEEPIEGLYFILAVSLLTIFSVHQLVLSYYESFKIINLRYLSSLKAMDIVGNDIAVAYDFGEIGLIVVDAEGTILWMNDLLHDRGFNFVDYKIGEVAPELEEIFEKGEETCTFRFEKKYYSAKYVKEARLFVLKDITNYESLIEYNKAHAMVIGYVNLDNYAEMLTNNDLEKTEIDGLVRKDIIDYFNRFNCLIKPIRKDYYMVILSREEFSKMIDDEFSIIKTISSNYNKQSLTCSLGFGYGRDQVVKNNDLALSALDVSLSRGGNQCVVAPFGESMKFYGGGNSESRGSSNKVKIKIYASSFVTAVKHASNVIIVPHANADMDAIGACLGVYSICKSISSKVTANIVFDNQSVEPAADAAVRATLDKSFFTDVFVSFADANDLKEENTLIVAVDHNRPSLSIYPDLYKGTKNNFAVIDHHRILDEKFDHPLFSHIDSSSSSTSEILAMYIDTLPFKVDISPAIATIMLSGIYLDTENFRVKTHILTHEAAIVLIRLNASESQAREFLKENYEQFVIKSKILSNLETYKYGVIIARSDEDEIVNSSLLASVCNELKGIESTKVCFGVGKISPDTIYISSRGNGKVNCELLMQKLGGGGHFSAAASVLKDMTIDQAIDKLKFVIREYLDSATQNEVVDEYEEEEE
ncbi:MAG: DHH family phosphoesterase [Bacilli bacterium]